MTLTDTAPLPADAMLAVAVGDSTDARHRREAIRSRTGNVARRFLPTGKPLAEESFLLRNNVGLGAIAILVGVVLWIGVTSHLSVVGILVRVAPVVIPALIAWRASNRLLVATSATVALMAAASVIIEMTTAEMESHIVFFVLLPLVSLYHEWKVFLAATLFVVVAFSEIVHVSLVVGLVVILVVEWRLSELDQRHAEHALRNLAQTEGLLYQAQKLESVGQLAAGVAHEINTPVQYLTDNAVFLRESFGSLLEVLDDVTELARQTDTEMVDRQLEKADMEFLRHEIPSALEHSNDGLRRVGEIVRAMKDFSHPGRALAEIDLNDAINNTVTVSRNEWKYVANLDLQLHNGLQLVECHGGQIKQVVLNLIVNAAHAIADADGECQMGTITIRTGVSGDRAVIRVSDTGCGMSPATQSKIFDQFFTTKEVGRGTGQGLSMVHQIVKGHRGEINVDSTVGVGTTFTVSIPLRAQHGASEGEDQ